MWASFWGFNIPDVYAKYLVLSQFSRELCIGSDMLTDILLTPHPSPAVSIQSGSSVCLFSRLRSQNTSLKFLQVDKSELIARADKWCSIYIRLANGICTCLLKSASSLVGCALDAHHPPRKNILTRKEPQWQDSKMKHSAPFPSKPPLTCASQ